MFDEKYLQWYDKIGKARPSSDAHGTPEEIRANLRQVSTSNWRLEGNLLIADTEHGIGTLKQTIPTDYICKGTDAEGLPILVKLGA